MSTARRLRATGHRRPPRPLVLPPARVAPDALCRHPETAAVLCHPAILLGGTEALLLQLAHPSVAAGVADHSDFEEDLPGRLIRTLAIPARIAFADAAGRAQALDELAAAHQGVAGRRADGVAYSAADPDLVTWVHATLVEAALAVDAVFLHWLDAAQRANLVADMQAMGKLYGVREESLPREPGRLRLWVHEQASRLEVSDVARDLARVVLHPPLAPTWGRVGGQVEPAAHRLLGAVTLRLLPEAVRSAYGLPLPTRRDRATIDGLGRLLSCRPGTAVLRPDRPARVAAAVFRYPLAPDGTTRAPALG